MSVGGSVINHPPAIVYPDSSTSLTPDKSRNSQMSRDSDYHDCSQYHAFSGFALFLIVVEVVGGGSGGGAMLLLPYCSQLNSCYYIT